MVGSRVLRHEWKSWETRLNDPTESEPPRYQQTLYRLLDGFQLDLSKALVLTLPGASQLAKDLRQVTYPP